MKDSQVTISQVRFSYVNVFEPRKSEDGKIRYSVSILIPKNNKQALATVHSAIEAAYNEGQARVPGVAKTALKMPLRDGDTDPNKCNDPAYRGCYFFNATTQKKPEVLDTRLQPILDANEFYSGCWGNVFVSFFVYNSNGSKGISAQLNCLQKTRDDEALGSHISPTSVFSVVDDSEDIF